jgi:uncharacterized protein YlxW (UPF0749 family)
MLEPIRTWISNLRSARHQSSVNGVRRSADDARSHRASEVTRLNEDIRRIQHEISDLNDAMNASAGSASLKADEARMASLHQRLAAKQRELATHQARI